MLADDAPRAPGSSPLRLVIEDGQFRDPAGRQVVLRGINVAGDAKYPSTPDQSSYVADDFFDGDNVKFTGRPFAADEAHVHFARLKGMGYNCIRYVFTWEAIEAAGPGIYDDEWCQHTVDVLRIAKQYGFYVFMDPHQDVWSRFSGGSGAPMWTLYACGLNPQSFAATEAAMVQNTFADPAAFPKMIWGTNYYRLAAATIFAMFFGGRDFAPKCIIDGVNIQDYLQGHFVGAVGHLAKRIHEAGDIENDVVFGWESMNEPNRGMVGWQDLSVIPADQNLRKGTCPTLWQAILTGSGRACEVDTFDVGGLGAFKTGTALVDPHGEIAWLPEDYDESRYGYKRDPGWKLGECIWAQHGVWDPATDTLLKKDYFAKNPRTGEVIHYPNFTNTYFMDLYRRYRDTIRTYHKDAILILQPPTLEVPPQIKGTPDDEARMAYAPHFYDGITLMTKKWNRTWNVDILGVLRGRYWHPAFSIKVGETAIRNCFRDQLAAMRKEGLDYMGDHPCIMTEFGIPYDMDEKHAYKTGDYSSQSAAMDANYYAAEGSKMEGYCLWVYMSQNDHDKGDHWNGEDLSVYSVDDLPLPISQLPPDAAEMADLSRTSTSLEDTKSMAPPTTTASAGSAHSGQMNGDASSPTAPPSHHLLHAATVTPQNLKRSLTSPSFTSAAAMMSPSSADPDLTGTPGYRAAEAYVRPCPTHVAGDVVSYGFDLRRCEFTLKLTRAAGSGPAPDAHPTVVFLPEFHFPRDHRVDVDVSSGKWEIAAGEDPGPLAAVLLGERDGEGGAVGGFASSSSSSDATTPTAVDGAGTAAAADGDPPVQRLRWWHGEGEQTLRVGGLIRRATFAPDGGLVGTAGGVPGGAAADDETYLEQCQQGYYGFGKREGGSCAVM